MKTRVLLAAAIALPLAAAVPPVLAGVQGGMWEVSRSATGSDPIRQCVADPEELAVWEHRGASCTRVVLSGSAGAAVIHYTCIGGGFGRTEMAVLTPRSLRLHTQGIAGGLPFDYTLQARRVADCKPRSGSV